MSHSRFCWVSARSIPASVTSRAPRSRWMSTPSASASARSSGTTATTSRSVPSYYRQYCQRLVKLHSHKYQFFKKDGPTLASVSFICVFSCKFSSHQPAGFKLGSPEQKARMMTTRPPRRPHHKLKLRQHCDSHNYQLQCSCREYINSTQLLH